jgi:RND family efflux transporter MFP subunit
MKRYAWLLAAFVLIAVVALQYRSLAGFLSRVAAGRGAAETVFVVRVAPVKKVSVPNEIFAVGELEAVREEQVLSQVSGYVDQVRVKTGDVVARGQVVATFKIRETQQRTDQIDAEIRVLQAQLREKDTRLDEAEKQLEKLRDLRNRDLIATRDLNGAETQADTARAERELAKARLDQQQAALSQLRYMLKAPIVTAPLGGVVTETFVDPGGFVQNSWPVLTVAVTDPLKVEIKVADKDAGQLRLGLNATVTADGQPARAVIGKVTGLDRTRAAKETVVLVEIQLPNGKRQLNLGDAVSVAIPLAGKREALLIPQQALVEAGDQSLVYVVANERAQAVAVAARPPRDGMIEVMQGLDENLPVVIDDPARLKPNAKVRLDAKNSQP